MPTRRLGGSSWPRISIVTPSYNRRSFIEESLRSVLLQGYPDLELVVVDGASEDGTLGILERYRPWLAECVSEPDRGWRDAVNKGLARCTGRIATFFASDDVYLPAALGTVAERWPDLADGHSGDGTLGAVVGAFYHVDSDSRRVESEPILPRLPRPAPLDLSLVAPRDWRLHQVATFYRLSALDAVGRSLREELVYNADRELLYRICRQFSVDLVPAPLAAFRVHEGSLAGAGERRHEAELEYARLQLSYCQGDADEGRRKQIAGHFLAKAQISLAKYGQRRFAAMWALSKAIRYHPAVLWRRSYLKAWMTILGLEALRSPRRQRS